MARIPCTCGHQCGIVRDEFGRVIGTMTPEEGAVIEYVCSDHGWDGSLKWLDLVSTLRKSRESKPRYSVSLASNAAGRRGYVVVSNGAVNVCECWLPNDATQICAALNAAEERK